MLTIYMTKGLPASGKTTWARKKLEELGAGKATRVNKDDLRAMMHTGWSEWNEKEVLAVRNQMVTTAINLGKHVIIDDTNLAPKHEAEIRKLVSESNRHGERGPGRYQAQVEIVDFTDVPLDKCIARDQNRPNYVGEKVIRKMYKNYILPTLQKAQPPAYNPKLPNCIIIDIDGTTTLMNGRSPYDYTKVNTDLPNVPIVDILRTIDYARLHLCQPLSFNFVSGRDASCRADTEKQIADFVFGGFKHAFNLFMRAEGDKRDDTIVKREIYENHIKPNYNVKFVLDDRDKVVRMWRDLGLTCLQVADGEF